MLHSVFVIIFVSNFINCNEFGHFIRECSKRSRDEEEARCFSSMNSDYYENDRYNYVHDEDYDDEVFATFNS